MRRKLIAGNWKMNGLRADGVALATTLAGRALDASGAARELLICPPATLLVAVGEAIEGSGIALGGQDCHSERAGAHTGDISAEMLKDAGCSYVIVGHSERRHNHGETDSLVRAKAKAAQAAGLTPIICVGETQEQRAAGQALSVIESQVHGSLVDAAGAGRQVVAYEPVWAIGTGQTATPADVAEAHAHIRSLLRYWYGQETGEAIRILYGGSVKPDNAGELLAVVDVDGALIGGASLKADDFWSIAANCP